MVKISLHIRENLQNPQKVKCWTPNEYQGCLWNVKPSSSLQWHLHPNRHFIFIQETNEFQKLYLESLVSAKRLFMMARAPTPAEKPFCLVLIHTFLGYPLAVSDSCFCRMARETLLDAVSSLMEIISPESLLPSVSLSYCPSASLATLWRRRRAPGVMALRRLRRVLDLWHFGQHLHSNFFNTQFKICLITIEMTLKREYMQHTPININMKFPNLYNPWCWYTAFWLLTKSPKPMVLKVTKQ